MMLITQKWQDRADRVVEMELGLTAKQWMLLITLEDEYEDHLPTLNEASESFGTSRQNTKRLIVELQKRGYLIIATDPNDKRILRIALTGKHREFFKENKNEQLFEQLTNEYFTNLSEDEINQMEKAVDKIYDKISTI